MLFIETGKSIYKGGKSAIRTLANTLRRSKHVQIPNTTPASTDGFAKIATKEIPIPENYKAFFESFGQYQNEEKTFWRALYQQNPEKFETLYRSELMQRGFPLFGYKEFLEATTKMSDKTIKETIKETEKLFNEFTPKYVYRHNGQELRFDRIIDDAEFEFIRTTPRIPDANDLAHLMILKANMPETYQYLLSRQNKDEVLGFLKYLSSPNNNVRGSLLKTLTQDQLEIMRRNPKYIQYNGTREQALYGQSAANHYVDNSDMLSEADRKILSKYLGEYRTLVDFTAYRGERDLGMFATTPIDKNLSFKVKQLVLLNFNKARKVKITPFNGKYEKHSDKQTSLLNYILNKKELTLADALQVMKYGDKKFQEKILNLIKQTSISDTRFKSVTFDRAMASSWTPSQTGHTTMLQNMVIKSGSQGTYSHANNHQVEFILNDNPKTITFQQAIYNPQLDRIIVDSTIQ